MINFEQQITPLIASRFSKLRETKDRKISPDLIAYGQKSAILKIEKGKSPKSGNFVSDTLLTCYVDYFALSKEELIFGTEREIEFELLCVFINIFKALISDPILKNAKGKKITDKREVEIHEAIKTLFYAFADFTRWYELKRDEPENTDEERLDFDSMFEILWGICRAKFIRSFEENVIQPTFNELDDKFYFNRINERVNRWLHHDVTKILVPEIIEKLKSNSIFKMGFMVKSLIDEFLVHDFPTSYLEDIPLEEFYLPTQRFYFDGGVFNNTDENGLKATEGFLNLLSYGKEKMTIKELEEIAEQDFFKGVKGVTQESTPFVNGTRKISTESFLDHIISMPPIFDSLHDLNREEQKIPGLLTVNSHASNLMQVKIGEVMAGVVNDLVRYQNMFINCIKWNELGDFGK